MMRKGKQPVWIVRKQTRNGIFNFTENGRWTSQLENPFEAINVYWNKSSVTRAVNQLSKGMHDIYRSYEVMYDLSNGHLSEKGVHR